MSNLSLVLGVQGRKKMSTGDRSWRELLGELKLELNRKGEFIPS